ncbi:MAG: class I poly(R)-hydroxyalkanoic acid synthase [Rhodospirillales bacterium]|nr:class I poly(R)-hydroxyalkanoic acid synthase [Rhodospirillales bacterium]MBO6785672.1 class I poly(R)-hydroxyalkanoic acid synthase [Rhodospirillales bacterium]
MADDGNDAKPLFDAEKNAEIYADFAERSQKIVNAFLDRQTSGENYTVADPVEIGRMFMDASLKMMSNPQKFAEQQAKLMQGYAEIWQATAKRMAGEDDVDPVIEPAKDDRRFKDNAWSEETVFDFIKQSYLLTSDWLQSQVSDVDDVDDKTREKLKFYTRQFVDALSPTNFVATNPKVLKMASETKGENLVKGLDQLLKDLERGQGELRISMTDTDAFELGKNVAVTPGKVVFQNDLIQLLQYEPTTEKVAKRPLLIVPPWINKFYILDLQPKNSFIKWATDQGHTVFVISWINPDERYADKRFEDYMLEGPLAAMDAIADATGEKDVNIIGYCIGGTLTASTLAYMASKGDNRVKSATFFTTMVDFAEPGELGVFIDEEQLKRLDEHMSKTGYLDGQYMSQVFNMMRDNDLIWSFVVNNYLLGREPMAFDLLYWNSDNTRMPKMMHSLYLRKMYLENKLVEPGGITLDGVPIDLSKIKTPVYWLSTKDDHIAPWKSTYAATQIYKGPKRFVLSASGHIAGVINPPAANKYCFWTSTKYPADPDAFFDGAKQHDGSWWPDWQKWIKKYAGGEVAARKPGDGKLKVIEDAPGSYVKVRI